MFYVRGIGSSKTLGMKMTDQVKIRIVFHSRGGTFHLSTVPLGALCGLKDDCLSSPP